MLARYTREINHMYLFILKKPAVPAPGQSRYSDKTYWRPTADILSRQGRNDHWPFAQASHI